MPYLYALQCTQRSLAQSLTHKMLNLTSMSVELVFVYQYLAEFVLITSSEVDEVCVNLQISASLRPFLTLTHSHSHSHSRSHSHSFSVSPSLTGILFRNGNLTLGPFGWVVMAPVGWVGVWGFWAGPGLVWMGCGIFAAELLWGGSLLAAGHQSSSTVSRCW